MLLNGNVHGKIYRRKYLEDNNIHFNESRFHEDNYFNNLVTLSGAKMFDLDVCTYYYTYNNNSANSKSDKLKNCKNSLSYIFIHSLNCLFCSSSKFL